MYSSNSDNIIYHMIDFDKQAFTDSYHISLANDVFALSEFSTCYVMATTSAAGIHGPYHVLKE